MPTKARALGLCLLAIADCILSAEFMNDVIIGFICFLNVPPFSNELRMNEEFLSMILAPRFRNTNIFPR